MPRPYDPLTYRYPRSLADAEDTRFQGGNWGDEADTHPEPSRHKIGRRGPRGIGVVLALGTLAAVALVAALVAWVRLLP